MKLPPIALALATLGMPALHSQDLPPWVLTLSRIKRQARAELEHVPNYACLETISRSQKKPSRPVFEPVDTLRIEVAFIGGQEMFAREGASEFRIVEPAAIISQGSFGTGAFTGLARNLFVNNAALTTGSGAEKLDGRATLWYSYKIPELSGVLHVQGAGGSAYVGEEGKFWVDAQTLELLRIEVAALNIPEYVKIREVWTEIAFDTVAIGATRVLLPKTAESLVIGPDGVQDRNVTEFTHCREYVSQTLIHFDDETPANPPATPKKKK